MHKWFKILLMSMVAFSTIFLATGCSAEDGKTTQQTADSNKFPAFQTVDVAGNTVTQDIFKGKKITVVNIWGTFCPPCIGEMPELGKWAREMPQDVQIIGLVCDASGPSDKEITAAAVKILNDANVSFVNILPDDKLLKYLEGVDAVPTTIFVDADGNIIGEKVVGADVAKYKEQVERYLK